MFRHRAGAKKDPPRYRTERVGLETNFFENIFYFCKNIFICYNYLELLTKNVRRMEKWISKWISKCGI